jgi:hypothetical protein
MAGKIKIFALSFKPAQLFGTKIVYVLLLLKQLKINL